MKNIWKRENFVYTFCGFLKPIMKEISNRIFQPKVETSQFVFTALKSYFPSPGIVLMKCESYDEVFTSNKARR